MVFHDFIYLIWYYCVSIEFLMWILKRKIEIKHNLNKEVFHWKAKRLNLYLQVNLKVKVYLGKGLPSR